MTDNKKGLDKQKHAEAQIQDAFEEASFEDKFWLAWKKYKSYILSFVFIIIFIGLTVPAVRYYKAWYKKEMQEAFIAAETVEEKEAFAEKYAGELLGAFLMLQFADEAYNKDQFTQAEDWYQKSIRPLSNHFLLGRAYLGAALARIRSGDINQGKLLLETILNDSTLIEAFRAESGYQLALLLMQEGDNQAAIKHLDRIQEFSNVEVWSRRALSLKKLLSSA